MHSIDVQTASKSYRIQIESGLANALPDLLGSFHQDQDWVIFTHATLLEKFAEAVQQRLVKAGYRVHILPVEVGEGAKTIASVNRIYDKLLELQCDRSTSFIALTHGLIRTMNVTAVVQFGLCTVPSDSSSPVGPRMNCTVPTTSTLSHVKLTKQLSITC